MRGYTPNAFLVLGVMVVLATLIGGRHWGLITVDVTASTIFGVTLLQHWGIDYRTSDWASYSDSSRGDVMARVTIIFVLVWIIFVVAISYVVARSEQLAEQLLRSVTALQAEQTEKTRIMADLVQREVALETLNHTLEQRVDERTASLSVERAS
jgi:preprotein translocase subunit SecG